MLTAYCLVTSGIFIFLASIWRKSDRINIALTAVFIIMAGFGQALACALRWRM